MRISDILFSIVPDFSVVLSCCVLSGRAGPVLSIVAYLHANWQVRGKKSDYFIVPPNLLLFDSISGAGNKMVKLVLGMFLWPHFSVANVRFVW